MRRPARSASTSSSVSKNQPVSSTSGSSWRATSARIALKPHWASEKRGRQGAAQQQVVAAGDELPLRRRGRPASRGASRVPIARSECPEISGATSGQQRGQVGGQVDVHVGEHGRVRGRPDRAQRPAAALLLQPHRRAPPGSSPASAPGDRRGGVGAGVVGDRDPEAVRELRGQVGVQPPDRRLEVGLLVVDGDDDVEHDAAGGGGGAGSRGCRSGSATSMLMSSRVVGGAVRSLWRTCASTVRPAAGSAWWLRNAATSVTSRPR